MSEDKLLNEGSVEMLEEVSYSNGNGLSKVIIVGAVIALGVATVVFIKKRKAKQLADQQPVITEEVEAKTKTTK